MHEARHVPYSLRWHPRQVSAGAHAGAREGSGGDFRRHTSLLRHPDPRRIDLPVTFRDPFGDIHVRQFAQRAAVNVFALVDLSGSMGFVGATSRLAEVAQLCAVLAYSAHKTGDRFGLIGCDSRVRREVFMPATRRQGVDREVYRRLSSQVPRADNAEGLLEGARQLPVGRSLVFLISDFFLPMPLLQRILEALWRHDVIPVVFRDRVELPSWGFVQVRDLETRRVRLLLLRPSVRLAWQRMQQEHREAIRRMFARHGRTPLELFDRFDIEVLASYLAAR